MVFDIQGWLGAFSNKIMHETAEDNSESDSDFTALQQIPKQSNIIKPSTTIKNSLFKKQLKKLKQGLGTDWFSLSINSYLQTLGVDFYPCAALLSYCLGVEYSNSKFTSIAAIKIFDIRLGILLIKAWHFIDAQDKKMDDIRDNLILAYTNACLVVKPRELITELSAILSRTDGKDLEAANKFAERIENLKNNASARISDSGALVENNICPNFNSFSGFCTKKYKTKKCGDLHICFKCGSAEHGLSQCPHAETGYKWRMKNMNDRWMSSRKYGGRYNNNSAYRGRGRSYGANFRGYSQPPQYRYPPNNNCYAPAVVPQPQIINAPRERGRNRNI